VWQTDNFVTLTFENRRPTRGDWLVSHAPLFVCTHVSAGVSVTKWPNYKFRFQSKANYRCALACRLATILLDRRLWRAPFIQSAHIANSWVDPPPHKPKATPASGIITELRSVAHSLAWLLQRDDHHLGRKLLVTLNAPFIPREGGSGPSLIWLLRWCIDYYDRQWAALFTFADKLHLDTYKHQIGFRTVHIPWWALTHR
jgi:hypothetical protein